METKAYPFRMNEGIHKDIKMLAAVSNVSIGKFISLMAESIRYRLDKYQAAKSLPFGFEGDIINLLLTHDLGRITDEELQKEMDKLTELANEKDDEWTPEVR